MKPSSLGKIFLSIKLSIFNKISLTLVLLLSKASSIIKLKYLIFYCFFKYFRQYSSNVYLSIFLINSIISSFLFFFHNISSFKFNITCFY